MGVQFDWTVDNEQDESIWSDEPPQEQRRPIRTLLIALTLMLLVIQVPLRHSPPFSPTITFAVPSNRFTHFRSVAEKFMREHPDYVVDVVDATSFDDPIQMMMTADAAVLTPDVSLLALIETGMLYPLNELSAWDNDFYKQSRSGVVWDGQVWVWPYALEMNVLYSDTLMRSRTSLQSIETWDFLRFGRQINLLADQNENGFLLSTRDILFSYAYAQQDREPDGELDGETPLEERVIDETLAWVAQLNAADGVIVDLSGVSPLERVRAHFRAISAERTVAVWVDTPSRYEYLTQLNSVVVVPWPHNGQYNSVAPLYVQGSVVSAMSDNPPLAMAWLDFISRHPPPTGERLIPSRQSIAIEQNYWENLPPTLATPMNDAFDTAVAITISDDSALSWERINEALIKYE